MNSETVAIAVSVITTLGGGWSYLAQRKTAKENRELQIHQAEAEAYNRARESYDVIINSLREHVEWLQSELRSAKERIEVLEQTIHDLIAERDRLTGRQNDLSV